MGFLHITGAGGGSCDCNRRLSFNREIGRIDNRDVECKLERYLILDRIEYDSNINFDKNELLYDYTFDYGVSYAYNIDYNINLSEVFDTLRKLHNRVTKIDNLLK